MNTLVKPLILATATSLLLSGCQQDATASQSATAQDSSPRLDARAQRVEIMNVKPAKQALTLTLPGEVEGSRDALASSTGGWTSRKCWSAKARPLEGQRAGMGE